MLSFVLVEIYIYIKKKEFLCFNLNLFSGDIIHPSFGWFCFKFVLYANKFLDMGSNDSQVGVFLFTA